jgi:hypothetical protein
MYKSYKQIKEESISCNNSQYWVAFHKPDGQKEIIRTHSGNFYSTTCPLLWNKWVYSGPLNIDELTQ